MKPRRGVRPRLLSTWTGPVDPAVRRRQEREVIDRIAHTVPRLRERLDQQASAMSGYEQQMLAIARATQEEYVTA